MNEKRTQKLKKSKWINQNVIIITGSNGMINEKNWQKKSNSLFVSHKQRVSTIHVTNSHFPSMSEMWRNPVGVQLCSFLVLFDSQNMRIVHAIFQRKSFNKLISHGENIIIYFIQHWPLPHIHAIFSSQFCTCAGYLFAISQSYRYA